MKRILHSFRSRAFRAGTVSLLSATVILAIAVALNVLVSLLPAAYTRLDTSTNQLYALTDEAADLIASYDKEVEILYLVESGQENVYIEETLRRAVEINPNITLTKIDPVTHPEAVADYSGYSQNSFIVRGPSRERGVDYSEIFRTRYYYEGNEIDASAYQSYLAYYQYGMIDQPPTTEDSYDGQTMLVSALDYVTSDILPVVYTLTGHGETDLDSTLSGYLTDDNVEVRSLGLATEDAVPEDASALLILAPRYDLSENECSRLSEYIGRGGHVIVYTYYQVGVLDHLEALLGQYGMRSVPGIIVETDSTKYDQYPYYLYPNIESSEYTESISGRNVFAPFSHGILTTDEQPENVVVSPLLTTSDGAFAREVTDGDTRPLEKTDGDVDGPFMVGAEAVCTEGDISGRLTWYSSPHLALTGADYNGAVADLFLSCVESGFSEGGSVALATKPITASYLTLTSAERGMWGVLLVALIPLGVLLLGLFIWNKRRKQ